MVTQQYVRDIKEETLTLQELQAKYRQKGNPGKPTIKDERSLTVLRRKYRNIDVEQLPQEPVQNDGRLVRSWEVARGKKDEDEWDVITLHSYDHTPNVEELEELYPPAVAARITPSRRKAPERDHKLLFLFSDTQMDFRRIIDGRTGEQELVPTHDPTAIRAAQHLAALLQPDIIANLGDTADYSNISRWPANSDHFFKTMGLTHQAIHDMYAQFRADNPNARIVEVDSNHNERFKKYVLKNFPQAYDLYRPGDDSEYPVLSYAYLTNLAALGVEFISGGQEAELIYGEEYTEEINGRTYPKPPLVMRHGTETGQNGLAVQKIAKNHPETHNAQGHAHSEQYIARVNRLGQRLMNLVVPPLCKTTGEVDSYHSQVSDKNRVNGVQEAWTQGVVLIRDYEGEYVSEIVPIRNGILRYQGKEIDGNET